MSFNSSADVLQRVSGGRFNVPVADDDLRARSRMPAEYGLVEAVLREAIREYQKFAGQRGRRGSRLFREVHEWFLQDDPQWDFSFINVCQILDLEPTYIRTGLNPNGGPIQRGWRCILSVIGSFERRCEDIEVEPRLRSAGPAISKDELTICRAAFHPGD